MNLRETLANYLKRIEQYDPQTLGRPRRAVSEEDSRFLRESLQRQLRFNNYIVVVLLILLCCLFFLGVVLIWSQLNSVNAVRGISGINFLSLVGIVAGLRHFWLQKSTMDILIIASNGLPPAEAARLVTSFHYAVTGRKAKRAPSHG